MVFLEYWDEDHLIHLFYTDVITRDGGSIQQKHSGELVKKCPQEILQEAESALLLTLESAVSQSKVAITY